MREPQTGDRDRPGWRPVTETDFDADGAVLDPVTGRPMTEQQLEDYRCPSSSIRF